MDAQIEYMWNQVDHIMQSIVLFDQKAAAIIAICVGAIYVVFELSKDPDKKNAYHAPRALAGAVILLLVAAIFFALKAIDPPAGAADGAIQDGEHLLPHRIVRLDSPRSHHVVDMKTVTMNEMMRNDPQGAQHQLDVGFAYGKWIAEASDEDRRRELSALVVSRSLIREWKHDWVQAAIRVLYVAIGALFVLGSHYVAYSISWLRNHRYLRRCFSASSDN